MVNEPLGSELLKGETAWENLGQAQGCGRGGGKYGSWEVARGRELEGGSPSVTVMWWSWHPNLAVEMGRRHEITPARMGRVWKGILLCNLDSEVSPWILVMPRGFPHDSKGAPGGYRSQPPPGIDEMVGEDHGDVL